MEDLQTYPIICEGGLDSNRNHLFLSTSKPGSATTLINYEPGLFGGYRKINGFAPLETDFSDVDDTGSEGKILGVAIYNQGIIAARKTKAVTTYQLFYWTLDNDWTAYTTGLTLTATDVDKIRYATYNFNGTEGIIFVDGINNATLHDSTNWINIGTTDTGADFANAGGPMALTAPKYVTIFKNHIFVSGDSTSPHIVAHSAPATIGEYDWTAASGAGQINVGFVVKQIKPFRNELYIFGETKIKKIVVDGTDFVLQDVVSDIGCLASDSVIEYNGDIFFLSQDGIRTIAATDRVGDIAMAVQSKNIQQDIIDLIADYDMTQVSAVVIRNKSQMRFFFSDSATSVADSVGILAAIRSIQEGERPPLEWGRTLGIRTSCVTSAYIGTEEYIIHGDYNGKVYRQEMGTNFDGSAILTVYTTPYIDFGDVFIRKNLHKILVFLRPETAAVNLTARIQYDWDDLDVYNPDSYLIESNVSGSLYGSGVYDSSVYATEAEPVAFKNVEGSGFSARITFSTSDDSGSHSIQAFVFEYHTDGRK